MEHLAKNMQHIHNREYGHSMLSNPHQRISWSYYIGPGISNNASDQVHYLPTGKLVFGPILAQDNIKHNEANVTQARHNKEGMSALPHQY